MKMVGSETIAASRETVWKALNDPAVLKQCIPGCESITQNSAHDLAARVSVKLGPVKAVFNGAVKISDVNAPVSYRISGQGQGGLAGFASGGADVKLTAVSAHETVLDYNVDAQVGGKLAMLGSRLIDSSAKMLAQQFFTKFAVVAADLDKAAASAPVAQPPKPAKKAPVKAKKAAAKKPAAKKAKPAAPKKKSAAAVKAKPAKKAKKAKKK